MRIGLYGGSFDPIHTGHIRPVWEAKRALGLDRVIYLPTAHPPHKDERVASPHARFAMVELALLWEQELEASAYELRAETAYTADTIAHFRGALPRAELVLLIGSDSFVELDRWRSWRTILESVEVAVMVRPGWEPEAVRQALSPALAEAAFGKPLGKPVRLLDNTPVAASSTAIRRQLAARRPLAPGLVPSLVLDYIRKYELYR
ncbi:MAG: nicotinate (nicotinamide) nucleotide adenylyltransferase [Acidobacteria bacterium]|nr:MAG: nicotinate (nicotinamide) nucleotide adenylyltransferase [Acidobacteriota bacterium]